MREYFHTGELEANDYYSTLCKQTLPNLLALLQSPSIQGYTAECVFYYCAQKTSFSH